MTLGGPVAPHYPSVRRPRQPLPQPRHLGGIVIGILNAIMDSMFLEIPKRPQQIRGGHALSMMFIRPSKGRMECTFARAVSAAMPVGTVVVNVPA